MSSIGLAIADQTFSEKIAGYIVGEEFSNIDARSIAAVKHSLAYHLGLSFRGVKEKEPDVARAYEVASGLSGDCGDTTVIGHDKRLSVSDAVFVNCQMMRSYGFDDVILKTGVHPGLVTLPVALSLSERHHASGQDLITSIIVGYEMMGKFAQWGWTLDTPRRATMPFGAFGSIAAAAKILKLTQSQTAVGLAYAAHMAMGVAESDAGPISHYYGLVCRNGVTGAYLAEAGAWGSPTTLEGRFGFVDTFLGDVTIDQDALIASFGGDYAIHMADEKRYPGTRLNVVPIEIMRELVVSNDLWTNDVKEIRVALPLERKNFMGGYGAGPFTPKTAPSSCSFQFGMLLLDHDLNFKRYQEVDNPQILEIVGKTKYEFVRGKPVQNAAIEIETFDGRTFGNEMDEFLFAPEPNDEIIRRDAYGVLPPQKIDRLVEILSHLEELPDCAELADCLRP